MKITRILVGAVIAVIFVVGFTSCDLLMSLLDLGSDDGVTVIERVNAFTADVNKSDRSNLATTHFHMEEMTSYNQLKFDEIFTDGPLSYTHAVFVFGEPEITTVGYSQQATMTFENRWGATGVIVLTLDLEGDDFMISKIVMTLDDDDTDLEYVLQFYGTRR